jgi:hypothetical protein
MGIILGLVPASAMADSVMGCGGRGEPGWSVCAQLERVAPMEVRVKGDELMLKNLERRLDALEAKAKHGDVPPSSKSEVRQGDGK